MKKLLGILSALLFIQPMVADGARVDFQNEIIPILTKVGCNAGACHGAAIGRGGFNLSLYGGNPEADFDAIVHYMGGRRINLSKPEESLIVLKPTFAIEHGGKFLLDDDDEATQLLLRWIRQGAPKDSSRVLTKVEIAPQSHVAELVGESISLRSTAYYSDGSQRDVTKWTVFTSEDSSAVEINDELAELRVLRRGRHIVTARYATEVLPIELVVPLTDIDVNLAAESRVNFIDDHIFKTLETLGLPLSGKAGDATFLRRATLDLTGLLPTPTKVESFLRDEGSNKRSILIEELLNSNAFTDYWTQQLGALLRIDERDEGEESTNVYYEWLRNQLQRRTSYKELAYTLITAIGNTNEFGPANFYRTTRGPRDQAEFFSELFMGSRLRCANCHNHPLDRWTQDDYHGLAAIFARVEYGNVVEKKPTGFVVHPATSEPAKLQVPGVATLIDDLAPLDQLADWLTGDQNPYFAKAIVNRLWKQMMGRGLVEPVDDFRSTNPATHPKLLDRLAADFIENGYSLRHTLKVIVSSSSYARSSNATIQNKDDDRFYSHALRRSLEDAVLERAIAEVLAVSQRPKERSNSSGGLAGKLNLLNGPSLNAKIANKENRLHRLLNEGREPLEIVDNFYLVALGRHPSQAERNYWGQLFSKSNSHTLIEDFIWGLLTSREFVTNH